MMRSARWQSAFWLPLMGVIILVLSLILLVWNPRFYFWNDTVKWPSRHLVSPGGMPAVP